MGQMKNLVGKPDNKKNLLWQIDYLEGQLAKLLAESTTTTTSKKDNKKPEINTRLWKTKIAVDRLAKHEKQLLKKKQNNNNSSDISQEEQSSEKETKQEREQKIKQQILQLKHQLLSQKIHHGQVQVQRCIKKYKTVELLKLRKMLKKLSSSNEEDKQQQEEKEKKIRQFEIKLATLKKFTIAHFSSLVVKTYVQLTYCLNTDLAATKKELAKIADDSNTVIFNHIDSLQKVLENFSTEDDNDNDKDDQKENKYIFPDWFPVDQLVLTKEQVSDFKNVYPKENNTNKDKEEDKCFKDYLKLITKLESVITELKELRGVINYVAGVRNRDVKSSFQPTTDSTTDISEEKKQEKQQEKHKKKEKSSTENEQQQQEKEDNIEYHGRDIVLTDEENDSITDLENLKSSGKYLTGTKKLNYDDISESEEDDDYYNQITDDDDDDEQEEEQKSSEDDDSDNEDEEFFENFSKKQDNKEEEEDQKNKKKKVKKIVLPALLQGFVAPSNPQEAAELERELRDLEREEGIINNDNSDDDNDEQKPNAPKIRKNRRGQRARREIYERKYGKHANHLKREFEKLQTERAIKQQQYEEREAKRQKKRKLESDNSNSSSSTTTSKGFKKNKVEDDNKPLHPSWEAKRKLKEQAAATQFKGKKIVFE